MSVSPISYFFGPRGDDTRHMYGYRFAWTPQHLTESELEPYRKSYDSLADEAVTRIQGLRKGRGLYQTLEEEHENDEVLGKLWKEVTEVPEWVDWEQIERGQEVFYRYAIGMVYGLAYHSLLGGMGAGRIVEVLARTGGFSVSSAKRRIYETAQHIFQCTSSLPSIQPGGAGFRSTLSVRLLHSSVRLRILSLASKNPDYYSTDLYGIPINNLDSIMTAMTFSASLIWISLPRQGIFLTSQEIRDYVALWRLISHYLGSPTEPLETPEKARAWMESGLLTELKPTELSAQLAQNIIVALAHQPPSYPSEDFLCAAARWLNGNELSDALRLPKPSLWARFIVAGQIVFITWLTYLPRLMPWGRKGRVGAVKKGLWKVIVLAGLGGETDFGFKFVPQVETITKMGKVDLKRKVKGWEKTEWRNLRILMMVGAVAVVVLMMLAKVGEWVMGAVLG